MSRRRLVGAAVLALGAGAWWWTSHEAPPPAPAAAAEAPRGVGALGRVEPQSRIRKLNQPGGMAVTRLERLLVAEGEAVREGQLLAEFADAGQKDAAAAQAEAALAEAQASLARTRAAGRPSEVQAQRARIAALLAQEEIARRDAARTDALVPTGAGSAAVAERNRYLALQLANTRAQAEADLATLATPRPEDVALAESRVAQMRAALDKARADAALARVRAPMDGTVLRIFARPGDQVGGDGLLEMADLTRLDVVADVFETDLPRIRPGIAAEVIVPGEAARLPATVRELGWTVRRTTQAGSDPVAAVDARTVEVRLTLSDEAAALLRRRSGMQVQVHIPPADSPRVAAAR